MMESVNNIPEQVYTFKSLFNYDVIDTNNQDILINRDFHKLNLFELIKCNELIKTHNLPHELITISLSNELYPLATLWADTDSETRIVFNPLENNLMSFDIDGNTLCVSRADPVDLAYFILDRFDNQKILNILFSSLADRKYTINENYEIVPVA